MHDCLALKKSYCPISAASHLPKKGTTDLLAQIKCSNDSTFLFNLKVNIYICNIVTCAEGDPIVGLEYHPRLDNPDHQKVKEIYLII